MVLSGSFTYWDGAPANVDTDSTFNTGWDGTPLLVYSKGAGFFSLFLLGRSGARGIGSTQLICEGLGKGGNSTHIICDGLGSIVAPQAPTQGGFYSLFMFMGGAEEGAAITFQPRPVAVGYPLIF